MLNQRPFEYFVVFFQLEAQIIITGENLHGDRGIRSYQQYMDHLWQTQEAPDQVSVFAKGYEDYLQCPLQPLKDNLESQTYEVFEKDPIKYSQYQKVRKSTLLSMHRQKLIDLLYINWQQSFSKADR